VGSRAVRAIHLAASIPRGGAGWPLWLALACPPALAETNGRRRGGTQGDLG
jgi:hypothetical protein